MIRGLSQLMKIAPMARRASMIGFLGVVFAFVVGFVLYWISDAISQQEIKRASEAEWNRKKWYDR